MFKTYVLLTSLAAILFPLHRTAQAQVLVVTPNPLSLFALAGGFPVTSSLTFTSSDGITPIPFTPTSNASWISLPAPPPGGWKTPATVAVTANPTTCAPPACASLGQNTGTILISGAQNPVVVVTLTVSTISVSPQSVNLGTYQAGSTIYPPPQTLSVAFASGQQFSSFSLATAPGDTWYTAAKYGTSSNTVMIQFNPSAATSLTASATPLQGTLTITPAGSNAIPLNVPIYLTVTASPQVAVSPSSGLTFNWQIGGSNNQLRQYLTLSSNAAVPISYSTTVGSGMGWMLLPVTSQTGSIPAGGSVQVEIDVNGDSQPPVPTNGYVQISLSPGALFANGTTLSAIPVQLNVSPFPQLYLSPPSLSYTYQFGSLNTPSPQVVNVTTSGAPIQTMQYNAAVSSSSTSWLTVPTTDLLTTPSPFLVVVNPIGMSPGMYTASVTVTPKSNGSNQGPIVIPITLNVSFTSVLQVSTTQLVFAYEIGQAAPAPQTITLSSSTGAPLVYSVTPPQVPWLQLTGALSGTTDQSSISVAINPSGVTTAQASPMDATIGIVATDPVTGLIVTRQQIDVKLYADTNPLLNVYPPGPLQFVTYPNAAGYPVASSCGVSLPLCTVSLTSSSTAPGDTLAIPAAWSSVMYISQTGNWLSIATPPGITTPTLFTLNATQLSGSAMPPGTYTGTVSIIASGPAGPPLDSPYTIPVSFVVAAAKASVITQRADGSIQFTQTQGGTPPPPQTVVVTTDSATQFPFAVVANSGLLNWLTVSQVNGPTPGSFIVSADATKLTTGTYQGAVYVTVPGAAASPIRIPVTFTVGGTLVASQPALTFQQVIGGPAAPTQTIQVSSLPGTVTYAVSTSVNASVNASVNWLSANVTAGYGATPGMVSVSISAGGLGLGSYSGLLSITSPGATNSPLLVPVVLNVVQATIAAPTTPLTFSQLVGAPAPPSQTVAVTATPGPVGFTLTTATDTGAPWLSAAVSSSAISGTTPTMVQVSVSGATLPPGSYTGVVTINSPSAIGSPVNIPVGLTIAASGSLVASQTSISFTAPAGQPAQQQTVTLASSMNTSYSISAVTKDGANWLSASPISGSLGTTPISLTISVTTQSLPVGSYSGSLTISAANSVTPLTIAVSLNIQAIPAPVVIAIVNAASYIPGAVSPGENIVITGTGIGPPQLAGPQLSTPGTLSTNVGNTQVLFDGVAAPILYASSAQTSVIVPYGIAGRPTTNVQVIYMGMASAPLSYLVTAADPAIYTQNQQGFGPGVILNPDNVTVNGPNSGASPGSEIVVYLTGDGATSPPGISGAIAGTAGNGLNKPALTVTATIGGLPATVVYCGSAPGIVYGISQANIRIPPETPSGPQPLFLTVGTASTQSGVTVQVQ